MSRDLRTHWRTLPHPPVGGLSDYNDKAHQRVSRHSGALFLWLLFL